MVETTLVIVHEGNNVSSLIERLDEIAIYNNAVKGLIKHESDDYQVTLYYYFNNDSKVVDFAEESINDVPEAILSTIQRVSFEKE